MPGPTRGALPAILLLAAALHASGIARSLLPAQDGLKFIRIARAVQTQPWADVIRGSDQHPLYPALVALVEPLVACVRGHNPETWRIAAMLVAALASLLLLIPLHGLARELFGCRIADLAALGFVLLPLPMTIGRDTLSDSLALLGFVASLRLGLAALNGKGWAPALGCGVAAGLGYLARPEVLVAPFAVVATGCLRSWVGAEAPSFRLAWPRLAGLTVAFLAIVGTYALVKGEVSEKLALRQAASLTDSPKLKHKIVRTSQHWLPKGLDDPRWSFEPKEEPSIITRRPLSAVARSLVAQWAVALGIVLAVFATWGLVRDSHIRRVVASGDEAERPDPSNIGRLLVAVYLGFFLLILMSHEWRMGYLSDRHTLTLVIASLPWAAAGVFVCARGLALKLKLSPRRARVMWALMLATALATGVGLQLKTAHPSRWGHHAAGRWLAANAHAGDAVLDTRGWAAFVSTLPAYDYWHVRQAFSDNHLRYIVVGDDELRASSRRAATLRAVLAYAAVPVASFPARQGARATGVWVYQYERPDSWEGLNQ